MVFDLKSLQLNFSITFPLNLLESLPGFVMLSQLVSHAGTNASPLTPQCPSVPLSLTGNTLVLTANGGAQNSICLQVRDISEVTSVIGWSIASRERIEKIGFSGAPQ